MKVSLLCITKHGKRKIQKLRDRVEPEMACPQCGYTEEDAKKQYVDAHACMLVKVYSPMVLKKTTLTDIEYKCNRCDCEFMIQIEETNERL